MDKVVHVAFYPDRPRGSFLTAVKEAKADINTDLLVKPVKAVPETPARVVAVGETPHWICDHVFVPPGNRNALREALEWALGLKDDTLTVTVLHQLREVFGPEVEEIF
mgnify:CR=1 FL=1